MKTHLSVRSDFSLGESLLQLDKLIERAKALGYEALALTDTSSIHAMPDFTARCVKEGIKPIIAVTMRVHDDATYRKVSKVAGPKNSSSVRVKVYVLNEKGMKWMFKALTLASSTDRFYYTPRNEWKDFEDAEGIAVATGDFFGLFSHPEYNSRLETLIGYLDPQNVYVELCPVNTPLFDTMNARAIKASRNYVLPKILTYPSLYLDDADASSLEMLALVINKGTVNDPWRNKQFVRDFSLQEPNAIIPRLKAAAKRQSDFYGDKDPSVWVDALKGSGILADRVTYGFEKMPISLPALAPNEFTAVIKQCRQGWSDRFSGPVLGHCPNFSKPEVFKEYSDRLKFELSVLEKMNFSGYFLLAADIVQWSKKNGIIVGPGRGSVGGSLVAYLMGITDVDPIRFNLLFERFINPDRLDLPDADLDFMSSRRHEVLAYLQDKYGKENVAAISNYSSMASASAVRDAGRIFGLTNLELTATKLVPKEHGQPVSLTEAADQVAEIELFASQHQQVWKHALSFEGNMRSLGQHAAGVVVSGEPIVNRAVVETRSGDMPVICWDKRTVEEFGLVKLDILGLSTLDVLAIAAEYIHDRHGKTVDYLALPLDDKKVMEAFGEGKTTGVFQMEGFQARKLLVEMRKGGPLDFNDIVAINALNRPGPLDSGLTSDYVSAKQGIRSATYDHPCLEPILKKTFGLAIYQEDTMATARVLCGFSMTEADHLRKAIGKKDTSKMAEIRDSFVAGATAGFIEVTLEDGSTRKCHRGERFKVKGDDKLLTIEEIYTSGLELDVNL